MRSIAQRLEFSRSTVAKSMASTSPPRHERTTATNSAPWFEARIRSRLSEYPKMPARDHGAGRVKEFELIFPRESRSDPSGLLPLAAQECFDYRPI